MIRRAQGQEIDAVAELWLETNLKAPDFIPAQYWKANFEGVKAVLPQAELYVYQDEGGIQGFIGLSGDYIAGIFVRSERQSRGVGRRLVDFAKGIRGRLRLSVYQKNARAVKFYLREGFVVQREGRDENTGEAEYEMVWKPEDERP